MKSRSSAFLPVRAGRHTLGGEHSKHWVAVIPICTAREGIDPAGDGCQKVLEDVLAGGVSVKCFSFVSLSNLAPLTAPLDILAHATIGFPVVCQSKQYAQTTPLGLDYQPVQALKDLLIELSCITADQD